MRILYVNPFPCFPATSGGRQRSNLLYRALCNLGQVDVFGIEKEKLATETQCRALGESYGYIANVAPQSPSEIGAWKYFRWLAPAIVNRIANFSDPSKIYCSEQPRLVRALREACDPKSYAWIVGRSLFSLVSTGLLGLVMHSMKIPALVAASTGPTVTVCAMSPSPAS